MENILYMDIRDLIYNTKVLRTLNLINKQLKKDYVSIGIEKNLIINYSKKQNNSDWITDFKQDVYFYFPPKEKESLLTKIKRFFKR
jgi:hypothetical protein